MVAHAFGTLVDLPIDVPLLLLLAAGALVGSAALLTRRDSATQSPRSSSRWPTSHRMGQLAQGPTVHALALAVGTIGLLAILALAVSGTPRGDRNPLPRLVLILLWGGLVPVSLLAGGFYAAMNPLRGLAGGLRRLAGITARPLPAGVGRWPAAVLAVGLTIASQTALDAPIVVSLGVLLYVAVQVGLGTMFGSQWFAAGDAFEVLSSTVGRVAPVGLDRHGALGLRDPVVMVASTSAPEGTLAFVAVLIGASWLESIADAVVIEGVVVLTLATVASWALAGAFLRFGAVRDYLVPATLPLAAAYGLQLFTVPLLLEGQIGLSQLSDPFGRSDALPAVVAGGVRLPIDEVWVALGLYVAFVVLHVLALAIAHRAALSRFDLRGARAVQFPLRAVLLVSLVAGLWLPTIAGS